MALTEILSPHDALQLLRQTTPPACLDVRSEGEWAEGAIPGFHNDPILTNSERHQVGICYKQQGQEAAFALGYELTAPFRAERVQRWQALANTNMGAGISTAPLLVCCWRGGARSRLACEWLAEAGTATLRVRGGYKSMRALLRERLLTPPALLVLSGATGTGKTRLLRELPGAIVDLEACANHRGSAFGGLGVQPSQQTFENRVGLALYGEQPEYLIEDESHLIGFNQIPPALKDAMYRAPAVVLELPMSERIALTHAEYVLQPLQQGLSVDAVWQQLQSGLDRIQRRLGSLRHQQLSQALADAMQQPDDSERHARWIEPLLADYYDPRYRYAFEQQQRNVVFRGDTAACRAFLARRLAPV